MEIIKIDGCTADTFEVDGKNVYELPKKELLKLCRKLLSSNYTTKDILCRIIEDFVDLGGDFEDLGQCETCGDWVSKNTIKLP